MSPKSNPVLPSLEDGTRYMNALNWARDGMPDGFGWEAAIEAYGDASRGEAGHQLFDEASKKALERKDDRLAAEVATAVTAHRGTVDEGRKKRDAAKNDVDAARAGRNEALRGDAHPQNGGPQQGVRRGPAPVRISGRSARRPVH